MTSWRADEALAFAFFCGLLPSTPFSVLDDTDGGELTTVSSDAATVTFNYTERGRQISRIASSTGEELSFTYAGRMLIGLGFDNIPVAGISHRLTLDYDDEKRLSLLQLNDRPATFYSYDYDGFLTKAGDLSITRDPNTGFTKETGLGAVTTHYSYDSFGQVISREARVNGDVMYRVDYTYDALGRIASTSEVTQGEGVATSYTYDDYDRLSSATVNGSTTAYSYDSNGNRLNNGALYDDQDRLVSDESFTYTYAARGALKSKTKLSDSQTTVYSYDLQGNLREVSLPGGVKVTYGYDGRNRLVSRTDANGTLGFTYKDQLNPVAMVDDTGKVIAEFIYGTREFVPDIVLKDGKAYRIVSDERGSVRLVIDVATGSVVQRIDYDPWGVVTQDTHPGFQPFGYAGGIYDDRSGLIKFGARNYDPLIGRWLDKDPIGFDGGLNKYAYVDSDPINFIDPDGLEAMQCGPAWENMPREPGIEELDWDEVIPLPISMIKGMSKKIIKNSAKNLGKAINYSEVLQKVGDLKSVG